MKNIKILLICRITNLKIIQECHWKQDQLGFAPFAALAGYEDAVNETARLTNKRIDIDEELKSILDDKLQIIKEQISSKPKIAVTYFIPDLIKDGGKYVTVTGNVKRIDEYKQIIILEDKTEISISEIIEIRGDILELKYLT